MAGKGSMSTGSSVSDENPVVSFFDEHPINEGEILSKLKDAGKDLDHLAPEDLFPLDQDHYGALEATDALAALLGLNAASKVLDVCSGMGGTSRYLAWKYGCRVVGADLTATRVAGAVNLTAMAGLADRVSYVQADACALELRGESFDAAVGQESFLHIPDKAALLASLHRVLKPGGGLAFTDWIAFPQLSDGERRQLREGIAAQHIAGMEEYRALLTGAGFRVTHGEDLSAQWKVILRERLEMFKSLEAETVRRFGRERHEKYIGAYTFFVDLIDNGRLGGGRFHAVKL